jgi:hypothetical protein
MKQTIYETDDKQFRIVEILDESYSMEDLKGDCYNPEVNPDIDPNTLENEERQFEQRVNQEGVFGYVLEQWNSAPGVGYEHLDSCWGFVGMYSETHENSCHYIVDEMKATIERAQTKAVSRE